MFQILVSQIFMNLFIAVIIDAYVYESDQHNQSITPYSLLEFIDVWSEFDPEATGFIEIKRLEEFILALAKSGHGKSLIVFVDHVAKVKTMRKIFLRQLNLPTYYQLKKVAFMDTLQQLCDKVNLLHFKNEAPNVFCHERMREIMGERKNDDDKNSQKEEDNKMEFSSLL